MSATATGPLGGQRILLCVGGGIAAYKALELVRRLRDAGASVQVAMTAGAQQFVTPLSFQALSGHPARTTLWDADESNFADLKNIRNPVLLTDGRDDVVDKPVNSVNMARQIPFSWLAFFDGGHAFLFQQHEKFAATVDAFLK